MYNPNYVPQYPSHQLAQSAYGGMPQQQQQQQQQQGRVMPSGSGMLPPVYSQPSYAGTALPGPLPYENLQTTVAPIQHVIPSTMGDLTPLIGRGSFVLQVDLWNDTATQEVNVIRASSSAPTQSISTAVPMSYPPPAMPQYMDMNYGNTHFGMPGSYGIAPYTPPPHSHIMYTRNLIGSLTVNASLLKDLDGNTGYWFVLSDLSVRTEGWFRLRMTFIDVGAPSSNGETSLNRARCPILADIFSDKFQVYSAKKFPGVIESTPLSLSTEPRRTNRQLVQQTREPLANRFLVQLWLATVKTPSRRLPTSLSSADSPHRSANSSDRSLRSLSKAARSRTTLYDSTYAHCRKIIKTMADIHYGCMRHER
ncbi:hypothetical protein AMS68_006020 [Peltaster fructicola]|uniref:Velvet domain-containing protein n=1 Tax=Peltaster fructicola TaxID=286661 RepID=A0A6H0Y0G4_9PEZI|nr:hypothetical protein AMS68_006020 [Peltaster fructicola]